MDDDATPVGALVRVGYATLVTTTVIEIPFLFAVAAVCTVWTIVDYARTVL